MTKLDLETICLNCNEDKSLCSCNSPEHQEITMPCGSSVAVSADEPPLSSYEVQTKTHQANPNLGGVA